MRAFRLFLLLTLLVATGCHTDTDSDAPEPGEAEQSVRAASTSWPPQGLRSQLDFLYDRLASLDADGDGLADAVEDGVGGGGAGISDGDKGMIVVSGGGSAWSVDTGVIGATQLAPTSVVPASYVIGNFTVDADGRLTAASSASAADIGGVVDARYVNVTGAESMSGSLAVAGGVSFSGSRLWAPNETLLGSPDTNCWTRLESSYALPGAQRSLLDFTTDSVSEAGGFLFRGVTSSSATNTLLSIQAYGSVFQHPVTAPSFIGALSGNVSGNVSGSSGTVTDPELAAIQVLTSSANTVAYYTGSGSAALAGLTSAGRDLLDDVDAAAQRTTLGITAGLSVGQYTPFTHQTGSNTNAVMRTWALAGSGTKGTLGQGAADLQGYHDDTEGALGAESSIVGGRRNSIATTSAYSTIAGGLNNFIGSGNTTTGYCFLGAGFGNTMSSGIGYNCNALVSGLNNTCGGYYSFLGAGESCLIGDVQHGVVVGGYNNDITGTNHQSLIVGGGNNTISVNGGTYNSIVGGYDNNIATAADNNTIGGGTLNDITATGNDHTIGGGRDNNISGAGGIENTIAGGRENSISGFSSFIGGGISHSIFAGYSTIAGGRANYCTQVSNASSYNTVAGGHQNGIIGGYTDYNYVGGGQANVIGSNSPLESQDYGTIGGGLSNSMGKGAGTIGSSYSTISGGYDNDLIDAGAAAVGGGMYHRISPGSSFAGWGTIGGGYSINVLAPSVGFVAAGLTSKITAAQWGPVIAGGAGNCVTGVGASVSVAVTGVAATDVITATGHKLRNGDFVYFSVLTGGAGLVAYSQTCAGYFVRDVSGATLKLESIPGTSAVNFTTDITSSTLVLPAGYASILGGHANMVDQDDATVLGGAHADTDHYGAVVHANGYNAAAGDAQSTFVEAFSVTSDATPTELFLDGLLLASKRFTVASGAVYQFTVQIAGVVHGGGNAAGYTVHGTIKNNGGTTALVGTVTVAHTAEDDAAWDATVTADDANDALLITVTGAAATTVHWHATINATKVK